MRYWVGGFAKQLVKVDVGVQSHWPLVWRSHRP